MEKGTLWHSFKRTLKLTLANVALVCYSFPFCFALPTQLGLSLFFTEEMGLWRAKVNYAKSGGQWQGEARQAFQKPAASISLAVCWNGLKRQPTGKHSCPFSLFFFKAAESETRTFL